MLPLRLNNSMGDGLIFRSCSVNLFEDLIATLDFTIEHCDGGI